MGLYNFLGRPPDYQNKILFGSIYFLTAGCLGIYIFAKEPRSVSEAGYLSESA
jgi:DUF2075 family protein